VYVDVFPSEILSEAVELIVSPGVPLSDPAIAPHVARGILAIGDIELFARAAKAPIIAITGSNGKSTVTTLLGKMIKAQGLNGIVGGNLGRPALTLLEAPVPDFYVLELSSFQLETTQSLKAHIAVILNVSPDHLDRYASYDDYIRAKQQICYAARHVVVNRDDPSTIQGVDLSGSVVSSFGMTPSSESEAWGLIQDNGVDHLALGNEKLLSANNMPLKGRHQLSNALACLAMGRIIGLDLNVMLDVIKDFEGLAHRCQWVGNVDNVDWYDDSKATNVGAAVAAIEGLAPILKGQLVLIAGGQGKGADFTYLRDAVAKHVRHVVLIGQDAKRIQNALSDCCPITTVKTMVAAVENAAKQANFGDAVLLAPACASFDMFEGFENRGEAFSQIVRRRQA